MKSFTLESNKSNFYSNILRIVFGIAGLMYLIPALHTYFSTLQLEAITIMNGLLGFFIIALMILNPTFGAHIKLLVNDEFMRTEEDLSMIRTAYWSQINRVTLTRFSIRITYQSGTGERFRLPFVTGDEHDALKNQLQDLSNDHGFKFRERAWWKIF